MLSKEFRSCRSIGVQELQEYRSSDVCKETESWRRETGD